MNTLAKTDGMAYERAGNEKVKDVNVVAIKMAERLTTTRLVWILVKRHKVALLAIGNIILVLNWAIPAWPTIILSLFNK